MNRICCTELKKEKVNQLSPPPPSLQFKKEGPEKLVSSGEENRRREEGARPAFSLSLLDE